MFWLMLPICQPKPLIRGGAEEFWRRVEVLKAGMPALRQTNRALTSRLDQSIMVSHLFSCGQLPTTRLMRLH